MSLQGYHDADARARERSRAVAPQRLEARLRPLRFDQDAGALLQLLQPFPGVLLLDGGGVDGSTTLVGVGPRRVFRAPSESPEAEGSDLFARIAEHLRGRVLEAHPRWPFTGGLMGWFGYDVRRLVEELPARHPRLTPLPDVWLAEYRIVVLLDERAGEAALSVTLDPADAATNREVESLADDVARHLEAAPRVPPPTRESLGPVVSPPRADHLAAVVRAKEHIAAGDIYQVNLAQCLSVPRPRDLVAFYRRLRRRNPAVFGGFVSLGDEALLSISPERFLRLEGGRVETRPIKGTAPRHGDPQRDREEARRLETSEKDRAELAMIVDVLRNDLSRVCTPGSVRVTQAMSLESHPTVHHLVSTIEGALESGFDAVDLLRATLPGGSITGAPRIRAMEIIDALEPVGRGLYTGSLGYLGYDGRMDLNILIRSAVTAGDRLLFHGGGGIVADSDPALEYEETLHKLRAFLDILEGRDEPA